MAKVILVDLEPAVADQLCLAIGLDLHQIQQKPHGAVMSDLLCADIVFAGGAATSYLALLRTVRKSRSSLPFIVVTRTAETKDWLDALEAGATDYCSAPFEARQLRWLLDSALPSRRSAAA